MSKVYCQIDEVPLENDYGRETDGIMATCSRCGHETQSFGTSDASIRRCLVLMRQECPEDESNFYVTEE